MGKKDTKLSQSAATKRKKRKESTDENTYIGIEEEPPSKSRRIKVPRIKKENNKRHRKRLTRATALNEVNINHASPKIWDIFERFQNFPQRKVLTRHPSGLLEPCEEEAVKENPQSSAQSDQLEKNEVQRNSMKNRRQSMEPSTENDDESSLGGDRKRRCVETNDYNEDDVQSTGKREPQPASAFKPKCLNFDEIDL